MRGILWLAAALAALYGGYWFVGSQAVVSGLEATLDEMKAGGLADYDGVDVTGFPSRFDLTVTEPELVSADGSLRWATSALNVYALSYKPHHVIAVLPPLQTLWFGRDRATLTSGDLRASAVLGLDPSLPLVRAQSVGENLSLTSERGWGIAAEAARLAIRQGVSETEHEVGAEFLGMVLSGAPARVVKAARGLPARGDRARLDAVVTLDRPLDRFFAVERGRIVGAEVRALDVVWGPVTISGTGRLTVTATGHPQGRVNIGIRNWRAAVGLLSELGVIRRELQPTVERVLEQLALAGGDVDLLALPLAFQDGQMSLGPIPLGPAPRL